MLPYFFVPASRLSKIESISKLGVSEIIIDLEDSVSASSRPYFIRDLILDKRYQGYVIRVPLYDGMNQLDMSVLLELYCSNFRKFVLPKVQSVSDLVTILDHLPHFNLEIILLIENPRFMIELTNVIDRFRTVLVGIGLGSHDFMVEIGGEHTLKNLEFARLQILYFARMLKIIAIDIASMELQDKASLEAEVLDGFKKGYDAKFLIHPWQVEVFRGINLYTDPDRLWAERVVSQVKLAGGANEFKPMVFNGQVIERPHIEKALKIIKYYESK